MKTSKKNPWKPRSLTETQWFWFLCLIGILVRFPFLRMSTAETTDGVLCLQYFSKSLVLTPRFVILPGYPFLLRLGEWVGMGGWMWGRVLSTTAGLLFLIPFWKLCRRWISVEMTAMVCLMALFSPLLWQWSLKVMPDTLFLLFFWWALERLTKSFVEKDRSSWYQANLLGALSACVRPEGFLVFPWAVVGSFRLSDPGKWKRAVSLLFWVAPAYFLGSKFWTLLSAYGEGLGMTEGPDRVQFPFENLVEHFYAYLTQPFYVFTPLVYWFALLGLSKMIRRSDREGEGFQKNILQISVILLLSRLFPSQYQDRHMLPFLPLILLAAGYHLERFFADWGRKKINWKVHLAKNGLLTLCFAWLSLYSAAVLISQGDSFGDVKRSAEFLKSLPAHAVIYSDEIPKTDYWSGKEIKLLPYLAENIPFNPRPGDFVVLHSFYTTRLAMVDKHMVDAYDAQILCDEQSMVVPLLTDLMEDTRLQNRVAATAFRFYPQFFRSRVYLIRK